MRTDLDADGHWRLLTRGQFWWALAADGTWQPAGDDDTVRPDADAQEAMFAAARTRAREARPFVGERLLRRLHLSSARDPYVCVFRFAAPGERPLMLRRDLTDATGHLVELAGDNSCLLPLAITAESQHAAVCELGDTLISRVAEVPVADIHCLVVR